MKKGTKKLAVLLVGAALVLTGCGTKTSSNVSSSSQADSSESSSSSESVNYTVSITNKEALQAEWYSDENGRKVDLEVTPKANIAQLINDGTIKITSNNTQAVTISGQMAVPQGPGQAKITVTCGESSDDVTVTITKALTIKEKYGVDHEGTATDPLTNEEAIKIATADNYNNEDLYVGGTIASFYHAPGSRIDGAVSWFLKPAEGKTEKFEIYKCYKSGSGEASYLTDDDVWVNGYAIAHGPFTVYNGQAETSGAKFVSCTGNKPEPRTTISSTFAEALAAAKALEDGADTYNYYKFEAYVTKKSGTNYFVTAAKGTALPDADAEKASSIELYNVTDKDLDAKLTKNAKIEITMILKNYHGQVENLLALAAADVTVKEAGGTWDVVPEPAVADKTLAQFIAGENTKAVAFNVKATLKGFKDGGTTADKFGNLVLTDGTNDLVVYGSTATATALVWNEADAYVFTNPQDFLTNATTSAIKIGDTLTLKMIRADYKGAVQGTGIITKVESGEGGGGGGVTPEEHDVTVAQALTVVNALEDNATTTDLYNFKAVFVTEVTYALSQGTMSFKIGDAADATDTITVYKAATTEEIGAKVKAGAQVTVKGNLQKYVKNSNVTPELVNVASITVDKEAEVVPVTDPVMNIGTSCTKVTVNGKNGIKVGTGSADGNMTVTIPSGSKTLTVYIAAWSGKPGNVKVTAPTGVTVDQATLTITADTGISGSGTAYTLAGEEAGFAFTLTLTGVSADTDITFASGTARRFAIWNPSVTK